MQVDCFLLADGAQESQGKLYVLGGGWNLLAVQGLPATHPAAALAIRLLVPWNETNEPLRFEIRLEDPDGQQLLPEPLTAELTVGRPPQLPAGAEQAIPLVVNLRDTELPKAGTYAFVLVANERELARTRFEVIEMAAKERLSR